MRSPTSPGEPRAAEAPARGRLLATARYALPVLSLAVVVALVIRTVAGNSDEVGRSLHLLAHPRSVFLILAVAAETLSYAAYASAQHRLACAIDHRLSRRWLASLAVAAQALVNFLPAGYLAGNVLNFRELRRRSLSAVHCAWLLGMTSLLYVGVLLALACTGAMIDYHGGLLPRVLGVCGLLVVFSLGAAAASRGNHLLALRRMALAVVAWLERRQGIATRIAAGSREVAQQMAAARLTRWGAASAAALFGLSWLSDAASLACGFGALGVSLPWDSLLVAYAAAQLVSFLPVAPGGFGLVEGGLTVTLSTGGRGVSSVLAAVLLYRAISYWGTLPAGSLGYLGLRRAARRRRARGALALEARGRSVR